MGGVGGGDGRGRVGAGVGPKAVVVGWMYWGAVAETVVGMCGGSNREWK